MAHEACPYANEGCPYWNREPRPRLAKKQAEGCFSDVDHVIPQRLGKLSITGAMRDYIHSDENKVQMCRQEHDIKTQNEDDAQLLIQLRDIVHPEGDNS